MATHGHGWPRVAMRILIPGALVGFSLLHPKVMHECPKPRMAPMVKLIVSNLVSLFV